MEGYASGRKLFVQDQWFGSSALSRRVADNITPGAMARIAMMMDRINLEAAPPRAGEAPPTPRPPPRLPRRSRRERERELDQLISPMLPHQKSWDVRSVSCVSSDDESVRSRSPRSGSFPSILSFREPYHLVCSDSESFRDGSPRPPRSDVRKDRDETEGGNIPFFACCIRR